MHLQAKVELWDVSGNINYQATWLAIMKDADAVLFVYNPSQEKELEMWYKTFVKDKKNISDDCCLIFTHKKSANESLSRGRISKLWLYATKKKNIRITLYLVWNSLNLFFHLFR